MIMGATISMSANNFNKQNTNEFAFYNENNLKSDSFNLTNCQPDLSIKSTKSTNDTNKNTKTLIEPSSKVINILVIDDSEVILKMTTMIINKVKSYKADCELTGEMSLVNIKYMWEQQNKQYDVILLDLLMPEMDGYEVAKKIRELEITYKMKKHLIIGMISSGGKIDIDENFDYGFKKPFALSQLKEIIDNNFVQEL